MIRLNGGQWILHPLFMQQFLLSTHTHTHTQTHTHLSVSLFLSLSHSHWLVLTTFSCCDLSTNKDCIDFGLVLDIVSCIRSSRRTSLFLHNLKVHGLPLSSRTHYIELVSKVGNHPDCICSGACFVLA